MLLPCIQQGSLVPRVRSSVLMELCHPAEQGRGEQPPLPLGRLFEQRAAGGRPTHGGEQGNLSFIPLAPAARLGTL